MEQPIDHLDDATAIRVLRAFATARGRQADYQTQWSAELRQALVDAVETPDADAPVSEGELARETLRLLARDAENQGPLGALIEGQPPLRFLDPAEMAIGVAALVALQTYVKLERTKEGKWHFKMEKKPLPVELIQKLLSYFASHRSGPGSGRP
jgi:hypothetical protein